MPAVITTTGKIFTANPGEHHFDAYEKATKAGFEVRDESGWFDKQTKKYLTRDEAYALQWREDEDRVMASRRLKKAVWKELKDRKRR